MAIQWGSWSYAGGNGMRVGIDVSVGSVSNSSTSVVFTFKIYTQNQYNYNDNQVLNYSGVLSGSLNFNNTGSSGSTTLRATRTYTYNYPSTSYGSSPGSVTAGASVSGTYNGSNPSKSVTTTIPARPFAGPNAPSGLSGTRNSDTSATLTWTRNATSGRPYTNQTIQRRVWNNGWGGWATIATASGTATSYVDNTISANRAFQYQIRANNSVGSSGWNTWTGQILTTPAAPSSVTAGMGSTGTTITVSWVRADNRSSYIRFEVQRSVAGGAWTNVATGLNNVTSWTDNSPGAGANQYRVRAVNTTVNTLASGYTASNVVSTIVPPLAPTNLIPNGTTIDLTQNQVLSWRHNPGGDGAAQTSAEISYSANGGSTWTVLTTVTGTANTYTVPAGTLANQTAAYQWRVRTMGVASAGFGPYSTVATFTGRDQPTVTLDPNNPPPTLGTSPLTAAWTWNQGQGLAQASWQATLTDSAGNLIETQSGNNALTSTSFAAPMVDGQTYTVSVRAMSTANQWSAWVSASTAVSLFPPADVSFAAEAYTCSGTVGLSIVGLDPVQGVSVPIDYVDVQRRINGGDWVTIMERISLPTSLLDLTPVTVGLNEYRVIITSITPSQAISDVVEVPGEDMCDPTEGQWVFLSYGQDFSTVLRFHGNPELSSVNGRTRAAPHFLGRAKPGLLLGTNTNREVRCTGTLHFDECCYAVDPATDCLHDSPVTDWELAGRAAGPVLYRDWTGRRMWGMLSDVDTTNPYPHHGTVNFNVTEIDFAEPVLSGADQPEPEGEPTNLICWGDFEDPTQLPGPVQAGLTAVTQDSVWATTGSYSLNLTPNGTSPVSGVYLSTLADDGSAMRVLGLQKGRTYTISADIRLTGPQTGTLETKARTVGMVERRNGTNTATTSSTPAPNTAGVTRLRLVYTVPTDAALQDVSVRLMNGSQATSQTAWFDSVMIEEGSVDGVWSDGCVFRPTNLFAGNPSFESAFAFGPGFGVGGSAIVTQSSAWSSQGQFSASVAPQASSTVYTSVYPAGGHDDTGGCLKRMGNLQRGRTYTISADFYMPTQAVGPFAAGDTLNPVRAINVNKRATGGTVTAIASSPQAPNVAGTQQRLAVTFTVPTDAADLMFRLMNGSSNPADVVYWDAVMIEEGTTPGYWSDGVVGQPATAGADVLGDTSV